MCAGTRALKRQLVCEEADEARLVNLGQGATGGKPSFNASVSTPFEWHLQSHFGTPRICKLGDIAVMFSKRREVLGDST